MRLALAILTALALTGSHALAEDHYPCAEEEGLRSANSNVATEIRFLNITGFPVKLYWIDFDGERELIASVKDGQGVVFNTFITHPWVVEDSAGICQGVFFPEQQPRTITVDTVG